MKLNHPAKRLTAALLSGAMLFTLSAPALAADPGTAPDTLPSAAAPLNEENGDGSVTFTIGGDDNNYTFTTDRDTSFEEAGVSYTHADNTLTFTGTHESLTIDAPGVNVKITGTHDQTLVGKQGEPNSLVLKITNSASVYISNLQDGVTSGAQAITGSANITSTGAVTIYGTDRAVGGAMLTVDAGGDVEIANNHACAAIWKDADITSGGNVTIGSKNAGGWAQGNRVDNSSLTVKAAGDVTLTGGSNYNATVQNPTIECGGKLTIENTAPNSRAAIGTMKYTNTSGQEMVLRQDGAFPRVVPSGASTMPSLTDRVKKLTAAPEEKIPLTLTNCHATNYTSSDHRTSFYAGETVFVYPDRPTNGVSFKKWIYPETLTVTQNSNPDYIGFTMPAEPVDITAVWNYYEAESQELDIKWNSETVKLTPASFTDDEPTVNVGNHALSVTYADNVYTVTLNDSSANDSLRITGYTGQDGKQPSVKFVSYGNELDSFDAEDLKDFVATDLRQPRPGTSGSMSIRCAGDVRINNDTDYAVYCGGDVTITSGGDITITSGGETCNALYSGGTLRITSGGDVKITGSYRAVSGSAVIIDCAGDLTLTSTTAASTLSENTVSVDSFTVSNARNVTISSANVNEISEGLSAQTASITCSGNVEITGANNAVWAGFFKINDAQNVTIHGKNRAFEGYTGVIHCCGNVALVSENGSAVMSSHFTIAEADHVTLTAADAVFKGTIAADYGDIPGDFLDAPVAEITCSGDVELKTTGNGPLVSPSQNASDATLTYNQANSYAYEVWADNALLTDVGEAGTSFTLREDTTYSSIHIIPDVPAPIIPDDGGDGGDGTGIAGAVVAGVAIGGAAAWGSYEIATRVILNDLLPEGAAIPANRGQLALLVWSTAGRPAPAAAPAFADVADPDTAAAAQWCVEQGLLDAKMDGSFDPNGWTPKFRVIEVWNKAFPKQ